MSLVGKVQLPTWLILSVRWFLICQYEPFTIFMRGIKGKGGSKNCRPYQSINGWLILLFFIAHHGLWILKLNSFKKRLKICRSSFVHLLASSLITTLCRTIFLLRISFHLLIMTPTYANTFPCRGYLDTNLSWTTIANLSSLRYYFY